LVKFISIAMDYAHPEIVLQAHPSPAAKTLQALRKVFASDPGLILQFFLTIPIFAGGIILHMNILQWVLVTLVTLLFLMAGIFRTAAILQVGHDRSVNAFEASRIHYMGNALVVVTAGLSLTTYLLIFIPKIIQIL
jgi:diacylglycerol kinase